MGNVFIGRTKRDRSFITSGGRVFRIGSERPNLKDINEVPEAYQQFEAKKEPLVLPPEDVLAQGRANAGKPVEKLG
jgi:hypothetical protein